MPDGLRGRGRFARTVFGRDGTDGGFTIRDKGLRINEEIRVNEVRLISEDGEQLGVLPLEDAQERANDAEYDLVEVAPNATPPVCRIMNYGKYKYEQQKREHAQRRKSSGSEMKELRLGRSIRIEQHDLDVKLKKAREILEKGHRLQVFLQLRGREIAHAEIGVEALRGFAQSLDDLAKVDSPPRIDRRRVTMLLAPLASGGKKGQKGKKAAAKSKEAEEGPDATAEAEAPAAEIPEKTPAEPEESGLEGPGEE
jgi:translation initiation factor IF-3